MNKIVLTFLLLFCINFVLAGGEIPVIILENESSEYYSFSNSLEDINITYKLESINAFVAKVTEEQLENLRKDVSRRVIVDDKIYSVMLDSSVPKINADDAWNLKTYGLNLTGQYTSVCVIDTGVDYTNPSLGGCYGNNDPESSCTVIGGYDFVNDDDDPMDDHGHGTHVAGIVSSSHSSYRGVAPGSKIIAIKSLGSSGEGSESTIIPGIEWCINNASKFNISSIVMSFGDNSTHNSYCRYTTWDSMITSANNAGIPVVVSSGNCDSPGQSSCTTGVSAPACIENATRVGTVDNSDNINYMRGALFQLLAPGIGITSTWLGSGTTPLNGTSMSAPHVAATIALMKQYFNLNSISKTVDEIESILNNTGPRIDDTAGSGYNFTRINVYQALLSIDETPPEVNLITPENNSIFILTNKTFQCDFTDWQLKNSTLKIWNETGIYYSEEFNVTGIYNSTQINLTNIPNGNYFWNCEVFDNKSNFGTFSSNYTFSISPLEVLINSPANNTYTNSNLTEFNCSAQTLENLELENLTFYIWNSSGNLIYNETSLISGTSNETLFEYNFSDNGKYLWSCLAYNNESATTSFANYTLNYDSVVPDLFNLGEVVTSSSSIISWATSEDTNYTISGKLSLSNSNYSQSHLVSFGGLSPSTIYNYQIEFCDRAGNCNIANSSFTTGDSIIASSGGGGGSYSNSLVQIIEINDNQFREGFSENLRKGQSVSFHLASGNHELKIEDIRSKVVDILIESEPISLSLIEGQAVKLNLSSPEYYDLLVRLNSIGIRSVNLSLKRIFEEIPAEIFENNTLPKDEKIYYITSPSNESLNSIEDDDSSLQYLVIFLVSSLLLIWIILKRIASYKNRGKVAQELRQHKIGKTKKNKNRKLNHSPKKGHQSNIRK